MTPHINLVLALTLGLTLSACAWSPMRAAFVGGRIGLTPARTAAATPSQSCAGDADIGRRSAILGTPLTERWQDGGC